MSRKFSQTHIQQGCSLPEALNAVNDSSVYMYAKSNGYRFRIKVQYGTRLGWRTWGNY